MEPNETILVSGRIVAEFEDDAGECLAGKAEFVCAPGSTAVLQGSSAAPPLNDVVEGKSS